jgi:hypothetical protein
MRFKTLKALLIGLTTVIIAGCGGSDSGTNTGAASKSTAPESVASASIPVLDTQIGKTSVGNLKGYAWAPKVWTTRNINVCWKLDAMTFANTAELRGVARQAVKGSWEDHSEVAFLGWNMCDGDQNYHGIRIVLSDERVHVTAFGKDLDAPDQAVFLNFDYQNWNPFCLPLGNRAYCAKVEAVHEFGHALGFQHEQLRYDSPKWCSDVPEPYADENVMIGEWDLHSVMNYCNPEWEGNGDLSATDIEMVQRFYGKPGGTLYVITKQRGPDQELSAYDTVTQKITGSVKLPNGSNQHLIGDIVASPDGKRVYVLSSDQSHTVLTAINVATNDVAYQVSGYNKFIQQVQVSPDSKTLYSLTGDAFGGIPANVDLLDASTGRLQGNINIPTPAGATSSNATYFMAKPQSDNNAIYVMTSQFYGAKPRSFAVAKLSVSDRKLARQFPITAPGEDPFGATGLAMTLSIDEKSIVMPIGTDDANDFGRFAVLDLASGEMKNLVSFSTQTKVKNLQTLDNHRILFANYSDKHGPTVFDTDTGSMTEVLSPEALAKSTGYEYVSSTNGNKIYSSKSFVGESVIQDNGSYKTEALGIKYNYDAGALKNAFAFVKAN